MNAPRPHRLLVVDDNPLNQLVAEGLLRQLGYASVTIAQHGREALERWHERPFDAILMDCQMPVMDGYEATRALRACGCRAPIIAMTANAVHGERERCLAAGMDEFLPKPVEPHRLEALLQHYTAA